MWGDFLYLTFQRWMLKIVKTIIYIENFSIYATKRIQVYSNSHEWYSNQFQGICKFTSTEWLCCKVPTIYKETKFGGFTRQIQWIPNLILRLLASSSIFLERLLVPMLRPFLHGESSTFESSPSFTPTWNKESGHI